MLARSQPVDSDDFGETIARFAAPAERSFLEWRGAAEGQMRRSALTTRAERLAGEHCGRSNLRASMPDGSSPETPGILRDGSILSSQNKRTLIRLYDFVGWGGGCGGDVVDAQGCVTECSVVV